jgi:hypothetical protein
MRKGWTDDGIGKEKKPNLLNTVIVRRRRNKKRKSRKEVEQIWKWRKIRYSKWWEIV